MCNKEFLLFFCLAYSIVYKEKRLGRPVNIKDANSLRFMLEGP